MEDLKCRKCETIPSSVDAKFCSKCGEPFFKSLDEERTKALNSIITFYITFLLFAIVTYFISDNYNDSLTADIVIEVVFMLLVLGFCTLDYKNILKLYKLKKLSWKIWFFTIVFPLVSRFTVYYFIEGANSFLFDEESINFFYSYWYLENPLFWTIIFVAILPPIFEELAFRGFLFNQLQKVANNNVTILATAFIFALVHFSFISFLWIFPFGLVLGYLRSKYNTLWLGIIIHFIHNFTVLLIDYYYYKIDILL